jgi:hypothetical protein
MALPVVVMASSNGGGQHGARQRGGLQAGGEKFQWSCRRKNNGWQRDCRQKRPQHGQGCQNEGLERRSVPGMRGNDPGP